MVKPAKLTPDAIIAAELQLPVDAVLRHRLKFNDDAIIRAVFTHRLRGQIDERTRQLETITPEELKTKQGEIAGIRTALALVTKTET